MNLQFISDNLGKTAGVFIPINDWNQLKKKYRDLEKFEKTTIETTGVSNCDWWDTISENEKKTIDKGLKQLSAGHRIKHSKVKEKVDKLLIRQ